MKSKLVLSIIIIYFISIIFINNIYCQDFTNNKIINVSYQGNKVNILDKCVWVRLKPSSGKREILSRDNKLKLTPLLPSKLANSKEFSKNNILSSHDIIGDKISRMYILQYNEEITFEELERKLLKENPEIEAVEPYFVYELQSPESPNDIFYNDQITLNVIKAKAAFENGLIGSPNTIIGISDAGSEVNHEDLKDNIAYNINEIPGDGIDNDNNGYVDDYAGYNFAYSEDNSEEDYVRNPDVEHGTVVTSIASATTDNSIGIAGAGNQCKYFPIKVAVGSSVKYGYQSIIYAGVRGFSVVNCSWGRANKAFSQFEQDIIDFAVSRNVVVVAASGNRSTNVSLNDVYYPANYKGVLGVGAADNNGNVYNSTSTLSLQTSILAPGGNKAIDKYGYSIVQNSTSYATPIVSGLVALIRWKYPELNAIEAIEYARLCSDDVRGVNLGNEFFAPGFVNFMKVLNSPPSNTISLRPKSIEFYSNNVKLERVSERNNEINIKILAHSYFADAENIKFVLKFNGNSNGINIINDKVEINYIKGGSDFEINGFNFIVNDDQPDLSAFRIDIFINNEYCDYFLIPVYFNDDISTFSNKSLTFSASDYGKFGFSMNKKTNFGKGFTLNSEPSYLSERAGITLTINDKVFTSGIIANYNYDFTAIKRLTGENRNIGILNLSKINNNYDIALTSKYSFVDDSLPIIRIELELYNTGDEEIKNPSYGYFFDWDLPVTSSNITNYFPQGVPEEADKIKTAAQLISNFERNKLIGTLAFSNNKGAVAQAAGFEFVSFDDDVNYLISAFNKGTNLQTSSSGDILSAIGMKFLQTLNKNEKNNFTIIIAYAEDEITLKERLLMGYNRSLVIDETHNIECLVSPNPTNNILNLHFKNKEKYSKYHNKDILFYNVNGELILNVKYNNNLEINSVDVSILPKGKYFILLDNNPITCFIKE